jgi:glutamate 5-kinase
VSVQLGSAKRVVIKIGSSLLVDGSAGRLREDWLKALAADVARLRTRGQEVILVSSGAIALGRRQLKLPSSTLKLEESQAAAAVGQIALAEAYTRVMADHGIKVAQILLTLGDTEQRRRYLNARATLSTLLALGALPVINENDTVATAEIRFGDNDRLAARVASMLGADCLVLLSDIDGLYASDPRSNKAAEFLSEIAEITPEIDAMAGAASSDMGSGGMVTKIMAARIATGAGCHMAIADGRVMSPLERIESGARCTWFKAQATPMAARKHWILASLSPHGTLIIDDGAAKALNSGRSLLPAGVVAVEGDFDRGDAVVVKDNGGQEVARGLVTYAASDARRIIKRKTAEIEALLGYRGRDEMIHRDDLVLVRRIDS